MTGQRHQILEKRDEWALNREMIPENMDETELQKCRQWENRAVWESRPPTFEAITKFFQQTTLCEPCKSIPVIKLIHSMAGINSTTAGDFESGCGLCNLLARESENENDRPIVIPRVGSWIYFQLLNSWIDECHRNHSHVLPHLSQQPRRLRAGTNERMPPAPLRIIDVNAMRLVQHEGGKTYVALSHRWNARERKEVDRFWSGNVITDINFDALPVKFQNAAIVTRRLGMQYLWIDGICIDQANPEELFQECSRMELIFSNAFCVIAAVSDLNNDGNFLPSAETGTPFTLPNGTKEPSLRIVNKSADFAHDVLDAPWNTRGWTFQERALACHSIYFTKQQTYWECENSIVCESQETPVTHADIYARSDFPGDHDYSTGLVKETYRQYSRRNLTCEGDMPIAILGLEYRLALHYKSISLFGVLQARLHETLLWKRGTEPLTKIDFGNPQQPVPSWSWMSRKGEIDYVDLPQGFSAEKIELDYQQVDEYAKYIHVSQQKHCQLEAKLCKKQGFSLDDTNHEDAWIGVRDDNNLVGALSFDGCGPDRRSSRGDIIHAVIIASATGLFPCPSKLEEIDPKAGDEPQYIALLVEGIACKEGCVVEEARYYTRIGLGIFQASWLDSDTDNSGNPGKLIRVI
ncbi:hypothetical protein AYO21_00298 [Fonsecaea monophora]|uniref:Heterokaryon incompatibility domain-containing protein n=1 Tax=Fonsecaea monophora TaxID=254056 RepID=A0A177FQL5_9EURO|nr:hypothetical protein AYO21_00298 [Fonsecaea monophora]KAH0832803.1 hypothetical protein FOPE_01300 [Fonsecaea pedrosoi]OAG45662.1 hypothetical protein AYO21_00298 [Fonsecaea monophora]